MEVHWYKCGSGDWCRFDSLDLGTVNEHGVYVIWHAGLENVPARVVYVGQGDVAERIASHRREEAFINCEGVYGRLYVTWASVRADQWDGVEVYLSERWTPLIGELYPVAEPIPVNAPW